MSYLDSGRRDQLDRFSQEVRDPVRAAADADRSRLRTFSSVLQQKLRAHDRAAQRLDRYLSTQFNVFRFIGRDENRLSDIFADLIDPQGMHGQGDTFLHAFLDTLGLDVGDHESTATVRREVRTTQSVAHTRRIDILIEVAGFAVAIENKPRAADQVGQIRDYARHLARRYGTAWHLIYLTPGGTWPNEHSIEPDEADRYHRKNQLILWSYGKHVQHWLKSCLGSCESDKYRWFLRDLRQHLDSEYPLPKEHSDDES